MRRPNKKAMEIMFNWIFILIVGAMIMMFFIAIVGKQRASAEKKESLIMLDNVDQMITLMKVSSNRQDVINQRQEIEIEFYCDELVIGGLSRDLGNTVMFAPKAIKTQTLFLMTKPWALPFKVMNMLYVSTPEIKYYIIYGNDEEDLASQIKGMMMINSEVELVDSHNVGTIEHTGEQGVKMIFINEGSVEGVGISKDIYDLKNEDVNAIAINWLPNAGVQLKFYKKVSKTPIGAFKEDNEEGYFTFTALGEETIIGAIYAGSAEDYHCAMEKAKKRLGYIADINKRRSHRLVELNYGPTGDGVDSSCADFHNTAVGSFEELKREVIVGTTVDMEEFNIQMQNLESTNEQAVLQSCARLY